MIYPSSVVVVGLIQDSCLTSSLIMNRILRIPKTKARQNLATRKVFCFTFPVTKGVTSLFLEKGYWGVNLTVSVDISYKH